MNLLSKANRNHIFESTVLFILKKFLPAERSVYLEIQCVCNSTETGLTGLFNLVGGFGTSQKKSRFEKRLFF
jgi:hypothetical protein